MNKNLNLDILQEQHILLMRNMYKSKQCYHFHANRKTITTIASNKLILS